jgi:chromosome partitioning protein
MRTIVVGGTKGGVGKTTLTANLAIIAHGTHSKVALLDLDPMQSLSRWFELRYAAKTLSPPPDFRLLPYTEDAKTQQRLARATSIDYLFIDCPPALIQILESAVELADLVLIPCRPSPLDLEGEAMSQICIQQHKPFLFVLNDVKGKSLVAGSRDYLGQVGPVAATEIQDRIVHPTSMITGSTGAEADRSGRTNDEIRSLWREIRAALR